MKKFLTFALTLVMAFAIAVPAFAAEPGASVAPRERAVNTSTTTVMNDPALIAKYERGLTATSEQAAFISGPVFSIEQDSTVAPNEHSVNTNTTMVMNDPALIAKYEEDFAAMSEQAARLGLTLKNRTLVGQRYYTDSPFLVDSIQGPMSKGPELEFETKATAGFNGECGVTKGIIEASFGVDFSYEETVTRTFPFDPIPAGKTLTYKCYVNYNLYEFDVYNGSKKLGTSNYWTPVGIVVHHSTK